MDDRLKEAREALTRGRLPEAESKIREVLREDERHYEACFLLTEISMRTGRSAQGIRLLEEMTRREPDRLEGWLGLATGLRANGRIPEALNALETASERESNDPTLLRNLGIALFQAGRPAKAEEVFRKALSIAPGSADAYADLGQALLQRGAFEEAVRHLREAQERRPDSVAYTTLLGQALIENEELQEAEVWLRTAIAASSTNGNAYAALGALLKQLGRFDEAAAVLDRAIELQPRRGGPYLERVNCAKVEPAQRPMLDQMTALLRDPRTLPDDRRALHYGLGKAYDDLGDYGTAIRHFDEANGIAREMLRASGRTFDRAALAARIDKIIRAFPKERFDGMPSVAGDIPIFVVGMVRSGTTLLEQIVSRHPQVTAGGELTFWTERAQAIQREFGQDSRAIRQMHDEYLELVKSIAPTVSHVTDKMPGNFVALGLMHLAFPESRIVVCRRAPVDNALSIYTTAFRTGHAYVHDRDDIVFFIRQFERLVDHWRAVLPADRFLEVRYEDLVLDQEKTTRTVIEFCGLRWDEACLHPEANGRSVRTPSQWQVRQPVYRTSVDRWRRYEPWLGSFRHLRTSVSRLK